MGLDAKQNDHVINESYEIEKFTVRIEKNFIIL